MLTTMSLFNHKAALCVFFFLLIVPFAKSQEIPPTSDSLSATEANAPQFSPNTESSQLGFIALDVEQCMTINLPYDIVTTEMDTITINVGWSEFQNSPPQMSGVPITWLFPLSIVTNEGINLTVESLDMMFNIILSCTEE